LQLSSSARSSRIDLKVLLTSSIIVEPSLLICGVVETYSCTSLFLVPYAPDLLKFPPRSLPQVRHSNRAAFVGGQESGRKSDVFDIAAR
jgi:hypothetical protein